MSLNHNVAPLVLVVIKHSLATIMPHLWCYNPSQKLIFTMNTFTGSVSNI
jgi:hypothetical protein